MTQNTQQGFEIARQARDEATLDLVVPFTTPALTVAALNAANRLGEGLHAAIRLLKVQVVPFPLDLKRSPVLVDFMKEQLRRLPSVLPVHCEIRLVRDFRAGLESAISERSLVILASHRRPWRTRTERLALRLRRAGYTAMVVARDERDKNA